MQPLGYVLRNSCSLLKNSWTIPMRNFIAAFLYNKNNGTIFRFWISNENGRGNFPRSWGPRVSRVQRSWGSQGSMGSWGTGGFRVPRVSGVLGVPRSRVSQGPRGLEGPRTGSYFSTIPKLRHNNLIQPFLFVPEWAHIELLTQGWHF